jgi:hypothetical protein
MAYKPGTHCQLGPGAAFVSEHAVSPSERGTRRSIALEQHCNPLATPDTEADEAQLVVLAVHLV